MQKCEKTKNPRSLCSLAHIHVDYLDVGVLAAVCEAFIYSAMSLALVYRETAQCTECMYIM